MKIHDVDRDFEARSVQWRRARDVYEGEDAVKRHGAHYLPRIESFTDGEFSDYVKRAHWLPATERTITMFAGLAFRKDMSIKLPDRMKAEIEAQLRDVTLGGEDFNQITAEALRDVLLVGRYGILLEWSQELLRPYFRTFVCEDIRRLSYLRMPDGRQALSEAVLRDWRIDDRIKDRDTEYLTQHALEAVAVTESQVRYRYVIQEWREIARNGVPAPKRDGTRFELFGDRQYPLRFETEMDRIPFVPCVARGTGKVIPKPPALDMINANLSHFRTSAEREEGAHWTALPTPWVTGHTIGDGGRLTAGGRKAWVFPNHETRVGLLEFRGEGLGTLKDIMEEKRADMAMLGARMLAQEKKSAETAEAMRMRSAESSASLSDVVAMVGKGMTVALWLYVWWLYGNEEPNDSDVDVSINKDFIDAGMDPQMLTALVSAVQSGAIGYATFYHNLAKGEITRPGVTWEEEKEDADREFTEDNPEPTPEELAAQAAALNTARVPPE